MTRNYLAAGPWMMISRNTATRIVLYSPSNGKLVVHNQTYENTGEIGREVTLSTGDYFTIPEMTKAVVRWEERNASNMASPDPQHRRMATLDFAEAANAADLAQQYFRNATPASLTLHIVGE